MITMLSKGVASVGSYLKSVHHHSSVPSRIWMIGIRNWNLYCGRIKFSLTFQYHVKTMSFGSPSLPDCSYNYIKTILSKVIKGKKLGYVGFSLTPQKPTCLQGLLKAPHSPSAYPVSHPLETADFQDGIFPSYYES